MAKAFHAGLRKQCVSSEIASELGRKLDERPVTPDHPGMSCRRILASVLALLPLMAKAEPLTDIALVPAPDPAIVIQALDVTASIPAPPWTETPRIARDTDSERNRALSEQGTDVFRKAYVPKGQSFENWRELYAVQAETPLLGSAEAHRNLIAQRYQATCVNAALAPIFQDDTRQVFMLFCPSLQDDREMGEMAVMVFTKSQDTLVQVQYRRRVPSFDNAEGFQMPATRDEMRRLVQRLNQAHLLPS